MPPLDWALVKAMIWVESGGPTNASWKARVMQIGNKQDLALPVLKEGKENSLIVMDENFKSSLSQINTPRVNIKAGVAYLINRLAKGDIKSLRSPSDKSLKPHTYEVVPGDSLSKIATKKGTTMKELKARNPGVAGLKPGQTLKYYKASNERVILGWRIASISMVSQRYNGGDANYSKKLTYVFGELFLKKKHQQKGCKDDIAILPVHSSLKRLNGKAVDKLASPSGGER